MTIIDLAEARRRRDEQRERIQAATQWAFEQMPVTASIMGGEFQARWPDLTSSDRMEVNEGMNRLVAKFEAEAQSPLLDYEATMSQISGREIWWSRLASWLQIQEAVPDFNSPEFTQHFGHLSRSEVLKAVIETRFRLSRLK